MQSVSDVKALNSPNQQGFDRKLSHIDLLERRAFAVIQAEIVPPKIYSAN